MVAFRKTWFQSVQVNQPNSTITQQLVLAHIPTFSHWSPEKPGGHWQVPYPMKTQRPPLKHWITSQGCSSNSQEKNLAQKASMKAISKTLKEEDEFGESTLHEEVSEKRWIKTIGPPFLINPFPF